MTRAPTDRVKEILDLALERPTQDREAFVAGMCGDDEALRSEILSLLRALRPMDTILEPRLPTPEAAPAEPLTGLQFGCYRVQERIGAGGMGVVYRAEDTRLGRTVAVKALPGHLASDPHRRARFEHEARVLAALNHPGIAAIHSVEDTARGPVMVLEYVPGETLAARLGAGPVPPEDAAVLARQILRALEAAHAAGVIHRDLKPANVHVLPDGSTKVLDFGIAKMEAIPLIGSSPATPGRSPGIATATLGVLGTASYMSPEQARGKPVDRRTDLWAFGCVLYEMLTGRRCFEGETLSDTIAAVLKSEPDWAHLPKETPHAMRRLLRRCLEKDPDRRQRDAGDARVDLETGADLPDAITTRTPPSRARTASAFLAGAALVALGAFFWPRGAPEPLSARAPTVRFTISLPDSMAVTHWGGGAVAVAPDGSEIAYTAGREDRPRLMRRALDGEAPVEIPGTEGASCPFYSPDGAWIGFTLGGQVRRMPAAGGGSEVVVASDAGGGGGAWSADGSLVFTHAKGGLWWLPANESEPRPLISGENPGFAHPEWVPGGHAVLFTFSTGRGERFEGRIESVVVSTGQRATVFDRACWPRIVGAGPGGHRLLFWHSGSLLVAPFDAERLRVSGPTARVAPLAPLLEAFPMPRFAASLDGRVLATLPGNIVYDAARVAWFDPAGSPTIIASATPAVDTPRLSPDGTRIAFINSGNGIGDLWMHVLGRGTIRLSSTGQAQHPLWTPDGELIAHADAEDGRPVIRWVRADQTTPPQIIWQRAGAAAYPSSFTPDGRTLFITCADAGQSADIAAVEIGSPGAERTLFTFKTPESIRIWPRLSPDGTLLAYMSSETGAFEVYLHRYPDLAGKALVSAGGGYRPTWGPGGRTLYFQYLNTINAVEVESTDPLRVSAPRAVLTHAPDLRFDVARDGRILMPHPSGDWGVRNRIDMALNWDRLPLR